MTRVYVTDNDGNNIHNIRVPNERNTRELIEDIFGEGFSHNKLHPKTVN
ncbi:MAG: hypothetical protein J6583_13280 [Gilliamella sp.]|nr:hypothetical protein [Gilliamella bombi]MCO6548725.1 hypothetical protein [Gilliamella sp.]